MNIQELTKEQAIQLEDAFVQAFLMKKCDCCSKDFMQDKYHKYTCHRCSHCMPYPTGGFKHSPHSNGITL